MGARLYARIPMVWPCCGLLAGVYVPGIDAAWLWVSFGAAGLLGLLFGRRQVLLGLLGVMLLAAMLGGWIQHNQRQQTLPGPEALPASAVPVRLYVTQDVRPTPYGGYCLGVATCGEPQQTDSCTWAGLQVVAYLPATDTLARKGETLYLSARLSPLASIRNEGYRGYLQRTGIEAVCRAQGTPMRYEAKGLLGWRAALSRKLAAQHPDTTTESLLQALLLGDRSAIDPAVRTAFASSGTAHLLAISGQHISLWVVLLSYLLGVGGAKGFTGRVRGVRAVVVVALLWVYVGLAGGSPSVVRAATVVSLAVLATTLQRPASALNFVALSAVVQVLVRPSIAYDLSYQLSHVAAAGILLALPVLRAWLARRPRWSRGVLGLLGVSLAAQLATLPFQWAVFGYLPTYALAANLVAVPLSGLLLATGWVWLALSWVPGVGWLLAWVTQLLAWLLTGLAESLAALPCAVVQLPVGPLGGPVALGIGMLVVGVWAYLRRPTDSTSTLLA